MNIAITQQTVVAINSTEWLNLCARRSIRLSKRRPVSVGTSPTDREMEKVFASAPFTKLGSSIDLFVLVIKHDWPQSSAKNRSFPSEILTLNLADVVSHHPIAQEHFDYYAHIGSKCDVLLESSIFEKSWVFWITNETLNASILAADHLQQAFGRAQSSTVKRTDKYKWSEIARLVLRPIEPIKAKPGHIESLISNVRRIVDAAAATRDSEQFYIACTIEWIDARLQRDPMRKKSNKLLLEAALENAKDQPIESLSDQTKSALTHLTLLYPRAFTEELTPLAIAGIVRLLSEARSKKLKPETAVAIINSFSPDSPVATLATFLLATQLGIEMTNQLVLGISNLDFVDLTWDTPNA